MKSDIYKNHCKGFYVYAKPNNCKPSIVTKYIGRYLGRPVIATSRIDSYSGSHVTFHYNRHEDNKLITETLPVIDFTINEQIPKSAQMPPFTPREYFEQKSLVKHNF